MRFTTTGWRQFLKDHKIEYGVWKHGYVRDKKYREGYNQAIEDILGEVKDG